MNFHSTMRATLHSIVAIMICLFVCCSACFIRNCPPGGKRSMDIGSFQPQRECMRCGPDELGHCVGPHICCGPTIGCYINSAETEACQKENDILVPCQVEGEVCGKLGEGRCTAAGVCCNDERCLLDDTCRQNSGSDYISANKRVNSHLSPELIKFLRRILDRKSYQRRK